MRVPDLQVYDHQARITPDLAALRAQGLAALELVLGCPGPGLRTLPDLEEIEVSLISDEAIAGVHDRFLDDPTPTDVITFPHGEILISTDTAVSAATTWEQDPLRETLLYLIHGLLHLNGHEDATPAGAALMAGHQERILARVAPAAI